jgi:hypothetical protein
MDSTIPRDSVVSFDTASNCEMYNSYDRVGLSVIRPNHKEIRLNRITANDITVFYPFVVTELQHNEPDSVALEYLYMKDQEIKITR